jgi:hypothetical protein
MATANPSGTSSRGLGALLLSVWKQVMEDDLPQVDLDGRTVAVTRTRAMGLKVVTVPFGKHVIEGIEQNPEKASRWAKMAQEGSRIMQFRVGVRYVANVCDGKLMRYPAWQALELPE